MTSYHQTTTSSSCFRETHLYDLPDVILSIIFASVIDIRTRNSMSLVCGKWLLLERTTRTSLTLRGNIRDLYMIPNCFRAVINLDLSLLSPWGHSPLDSSPDPLFLSHLLHQAFPSVQSLTLYSRTSSTLQYLAPQWPTLRHVNLVRWHQRSPVPLGSDFVPLFENCNSISSLVLSHFYCWTEDLPPALTAHPVVAASLAHLDLLTLSSSEGFKSHELLAISAACPNLNRLLAGCMFDPRYIDFVGDEALLGVASNCPNLSLLHLADASTFLNARADPDDEGFTDEDARISRSTLEELFTGLPLLEELVLDVCHNVRDSGHALEVLNTKCPNLKSLKLGQFHGICKSIGSQLDGIALCKGLEALSIKNSADLTDSALMTISRGCPKLVKFEVEGCKMITETGLKNLVSMLRRTLIDVKISCCKNLDAACALWALEPIRNRIQRLHIDCVWDSLDNNRSESPERAFNNFDLNESGLETNSTSEFKDYVTAKRSSNNRGGDTSEKKKKKKKCRYFEDMGDGSLSMMNNNQSGFREKTWNRLKYLSLWIAVGDLLSPLHLAGLESCPALEEIRIRVEGDCRRRARPTEQAFGLSSLEAFGLSSLARFPQLSKMKLDCGDTIGFALTAPTGQMDLSLWERFYLNGIENLNLYELDYWPPQDRDVNQRSLSLPAAGLLALCKTLRKLFIHGTAHEHFMMFLLGIPNLRDVQLREDYYPAPEDDMSTEMRVDSCSRFEDALNWRQIPD